jgi:hypothetical protein
MMKTMSEPYVVNVSSVQDFQQCRFRWYCKWVLNRVPRHEGPALEAGKLLHLIFEDHFQNDVPLKVAAVNRVRELGVRMQDPALDSHEKQTLAKAITTIDDLMEALSLWRDIYPMEVATLECEQSFEIELPECPGVIFRGRPDRLCIMGGCIWHVQNRGLAASMNFGTYIRLAKRHAHEHLYAEWLSRKYADLGTYGGTLFNLVRKLKYRTYVGKKNETVKTAAEMFWQHPLSIRLASDGHRDVMSDLFNHVDQMQDTIRRARNSKGLWRPAPNDKMNGGFNGSSEDFFFKVLIREIELSDDRYFKDREETYAVADVDAGQD